jgi:acetylornithine deacetylase/succinyl-diaminopimelate desuccinylase-like protein
LETIFEVRISADVTVATLQQDVHSGMFGGPAPDAFMALVRMLDTLTDHRGTCAVAGLNAMHNPDWPGSSPEEEQVFRDQAGVLSGVGLTGAGSITQRVAGSPSINVVGLDGVPGTNQAVNRLQHQVTARISVRIAPDQAPEEAYPALRTHLRAMAPYGIVPTVQPAGLNPGYVVPEGDGPWYGSAAQAIADAYGVTSDKVVQAGLGGTIPTVGVIAQAQHKPVTMILWGTEEPTCRIHSQPESVSYDELDRMIRAEVNLLANVGARGSMQG